MKISIGSHHKFSIPNLDLADLGKKIAIVGNSGILLDKEYGELIDSHDVVVRFNVAKVDGFEKHVGSKTTLRCVNDTILNFAIGLGDLEDIKLKFPDFNPNYIFNLKDQIILFKNVRDRSSILDDAFRKIEKNNNQIKFIHPKFLDECNSLIDSFEVTTGFMMIIAGITFFKNISCFGFSFYEDEWNKKHYFERINPFNQTYLHNIVSEKNIVLELAKHNKIKIYF
jgi:hypothetical protein